MNFSTDLNDYLLEHNHPLSSPEVFSKLDGGKIFFKLDLLEAYLQTQVEEDCAHLLCMYVNHYQNRGKIRQTSLNSMYHAFVNCFRYLCCYKETGSLGLPTFDLEKHSG